MSQLVGLMGAFGSILGQPDVLLLVLGGAALGLILGATPGLTGMVGIALMIPFSYYISPLAAIGMLYALHKTAIYGGSITAILINTPGTAAAACTQLDGYPLTQQGKSGKALRTAVVASAIADTGSELVLVFATFHLAQLMWVFGPVQLTAVLFFALTLIAGVTGRSVIKGLVSAMIGMLIATVGLDPSTAGERFVFGNFELMDGLGLVPVLVGLFVVSEVLVQLERTSGTETAQLLAPPPKHPDDTRLTKREFVGILPTVGFSYVIGQIIGIIPGLGAAVAPWVAYGQARSFSRKPEEFGKGSLNGIAAAEAANNATSGANLIPLLTLGIPGSTAVAVIMSVFILHGVEFGPRIFQNNAELVYGIFAVGFIAIAFYFLVGYFLARQVGWLITKIPVRIVYPLVVATTVIGAYALRSSVFDVGVLFVFGLVGYVLRKTKFPLPPLVIAFIVGARFERAFRTSLQLSENNAWIFLTDPVSRVIVILTVALLAWNLWRELRPSKSKSGTVEVGS